MSSGKKYNRPPDFSMIIIYLIFDKHIAVIIIMSRISKVITTILSF